MNSVFIDCTILFGALLLILGAAELFTNGIEWLGQHLGLSEGVVGSVLAAVGTALPETLIPFVAVMFFHSSDSHAVGIGAIAGAPFMLTTLTFSLCGTAVVLFARAGKRKHELNINTVVISRDLSYFIGCYTIGMLATLLAPVPQMRWIVAGILVLSYGMYLRATFAHSGETGEAPEHLHLNWLLKSGTGLVPVIGQVVLGLCGILGGSFLFVNYVQNLAHAAGIPALILSMVIAPIATELPEKVNSVLWAKTGKDTLALGNISGALVFQSCFPVAFGVACTEWELGPAVIISGVVAILSASFFLFKIKRNELRPQHLMLGALAYTGTMVYIAFAHPMK